MLICTYDNRPKALLGMKLLVLSINRHCPGVQVLISYPAKAPGFTSWLNRFPHADMRYDPDFTTHGWDVKPSLLLRLLDEGHHELIWLDSDIILTSDIRRFFTNRNDQDLVVSEAWDWDRHPGGSIRTELWGLDVGRRLTATLSSGVIRVTPSHRELLMAWREMLELPCYRKAQTIHPMAVRPIHLQGDQDVLTALVGSKAFSHIPLHTIRRGSEIAQCVGPAGFTATERRRCGREHVPPLLHGAEPKIWDVRPQTNWCGNPRAYYNQLTFELSPYNHAARSYLDELNETPPALTHCSIPGRFCRWLTRDHPVRQGLTLARLHGLGKQIKYLTGLTRIPHHNTFQPERANIAMTDTP